MPMSLSNDFWSEPWPYDPEEPPVTASSLRQWETTFGLPVPDLLAAALQVQNGGYIADTGIIICPLSQIRPLTAEPWNTRWENGKWENTEFGAPNRLVFFGVLDGLPVSLILNYNAGVVPNVIFMWHDLGDELRDEHSGSLEDLIASESQKMSGL